MRRLSTIGVSFSIKRSAVSVPTGDGNRDRHAAFAGRAVAGTHQGVGGLVEIGIRHDDHVVLGAAEALGALAIHGSRAVDITGNRGRADEGYGGNVGMRQDRIDRTLVAVDDVQDTGRQTGFDHQFSQTDRHGRITLRRLQDEGVAAGDRRGKHPHWDHGREIERRDAGADADGLADRIHVDIRTRTFGELALGKMRNADDEFADFQTRE